MMGDVVDIRTAKKRREGKPSEKAEERIEGGKIARAFAKWGHLNGSETRKRKTGWLEKPEPEEKEDDTQTFTD